MKMHSTLLPRLILFAAVYCLPSTEASQYSKQFAGPFDIVVKEVAQCSSKNVSAVYDKTKISRFNRTTYLYSSNLTISKPFDDDTEVAISVAVFGNGGWKDNYHQMAIPQICTYVKNNVRETSEIFFKAMGEKTCPLPAGKYQVNNLPLTVVVPIPVLPYNRYRVDGIMKYKGKPYGCFRFFMDIVPKKRT